MRPSTAAGTPTWPAPPIWRGPYNGIRIELEISVGDNVVYGQYSGTPYRVGDNDLVIVKGSDILARIG